MMLKALGLAAAATLLIGAAPPTAGPPSLGGGSVMTAVERLKPGEYLWAPEIAPQGPVLVIVSLATQRAVVYRNGVPIGVSTVSTGKDGHETPTGVFTILQKDIDHKSNIYDNAPMPYMQRLTWGGVALHAGKLPGYPASHGCIRLPLAFAKLLYGVTRLGMTVVVTDQVALPRVAPSPTLLSEPSGDVAAGAMRWRPEAAAEGPVSVVVSAADRRAIVLRNGKEIGSAPVEIRAPITSVSAYSLVALDANGWRWMRLPLSGQDADAPSPRGKIGLGGEFRKTVLSVLRPGATVVITPDTLRAGGTGQALDGIVAGPEQ